MHNHTAILVLNRNMRDMTEKLIDRIRKTCKGSYTIYAIEAESDMDKTVRNADTTIYCTENKRWAWSFSNAMRAVIELSECNLEIADDENWRIVLDPIPGTDIATIIKPSKKSKNWKLVTHFWLICNDAQLDENIDTLKTMMENMPTDACQIHPYQHTHPMNSPQGMKESGQQTKIHNVAFVEFVCPLITRSFYDKCLANFGCPPVGAYFPYGWGVDYEMAYFGHELKLKSYICDLVGMTHHPGTTHLNHQQTKVEDNNQMRVLARNTMLQVLETRYGRNWGDKFANSARAAGVDPQAFLDWSSYDRALSSHGARV